MRDDLRLVPALLPDIHRADKGKVGLVVSPSMYATVKDAHIGFQSLLTEIP